MIKVRMLATDEIRTVTPNVAFDLIDRGLAEKATNKKITTIQAAPQNYSTRQLRPDVEK